MIDKTSLSYWFPMLVSAGIPVPETKILSMSHHAQRDVMAAFDGGSSSGGVESFISEIAIAAEEFGFPFFLRTDHTSGKHNWDRNCAVQSTNVIGERIMGIVEYSEMAGIIGLPWDVWVIREMLPTKPLGFCHRYGNMPICKEFRFFVKDGQMQCVHAYWPMDALRQGGAPDDLDLQELFLLPADPSDIIDLAEAAGRAVPGYWSIDILDTSNGWFVTDMAEAEKSFHWKGCSYAG